MVLWAFGVLAVWSSPLGAALYLLTPWPRALICATTSTRAADEAAQSLPLMFRPE